MGGKRTLTILMLDGDNSRCLGGMAMMAFIYRMRLKPGRELEYDAAWREGTLIASEQFGSGGSHLFKLDNEVRVAIALWPDQESRDRYFAWRRENPTPASHILADAMDEFLGEEVLTSIDDLWAYRKG